MFDRLLYALNAIGTAWIFALMLLVCSDVASRTLFNAPLRGVAEVSGFSVVAILFLQLPSTVRERRLTRAEFLIDRLHVWSPRLAVALELAYALIGALVFAAILWGSVEGLAQAWQGNDTFGVEQVFTFPKWPIWLIVMVGSGCVLAAFLAQGTADALRLRRSATRAADKP